MLRGKPHSKQARSRRTKPRRARVVPTAAKRSPIDSPHPQSQRASSQPSWWRDLNREDELVSVYILNLDIEQSSSVKEHVLAIKKHVNGLQRDIDTALAGSGAALGGWSGDGQVALFDGHKPEADGCVGAGLNLLETFQRFKRGLPPAWGKVNLRIGIVHGQVPWDKEIGQVIAPPMNVAGHFQKYCPGGSILIDQGVYDLLINGDLKSCFELDTLVPHAGIRVKARSYHIPTQSRPTTFPVHERSIRRQLEDHEVIVRAPATVYIVGDFDSIFGYPSLIMPLPLYSYVGLSRMDRPGLEIEGFSVPPETADWYDRTNGMRFPESTYSIHVQKLEKRLLHQTLRHAFPDLAQHGVRLRNISMIPTRCGLGASSAFGVAAAIGIELLRSSSSDKAVAALADGDPALLHAADPFYSRTHKLAWAIDNIYEAGASSGGGAFASLYGSPDGLPLTYIGEKRGFEGGYPFQFSGQGPQTSYADPDFARIGALGFRAMPKRRDVKLGLALLFTQTRGNKRSGAILEDFFKRVRGIARDGLASRLKDQFNAYKHRRELIVKLARRTHYEQLGCALHPQERFGDPQASRDLFVEWFAQALGCVSFAAQSGFMQMESAADPHTELFFRQIDAYQELRSALGISPPIADYFNYRTDLLRYEISGETLIPGSAPRYVPMGGKLVGSGGGGDLMLLAPEVVLREQFPFIRRGLSADPLACHYVSWHSAELKLPAATCRAWRRRRSD